MTGAAQSEHIFGTLKALLAAYGATFEDIVNIRTFLTDMSRLREYADVRLKHITTTKPTSTTVEVSKLFKPGAMLEVELVAVVPGAR